MLTKCETRQGVLYTLDHGALPVYVVHLYCEGEQIFSQVFLGRSFISSKACRVNYHLNFRVERRSTGYIRQYYDGAPDIIQVGEHQFVEKRLIELWISLMLVSWCVCQFVFELSLTDLYPGLRRQIVLGSIISPFHEVIIHLLAGHLDLNFQRSMYGMGLPFFAFSRIAIVVMILLWFHIQALRRIALLMLYRPETIAFELLDNLKLDIIAISVLVSTMMLMESVRFCILLDPFLLFLIRFSDKNSLCCCD
jgi:hypothetical protein